MRRPSRVIVSIVATVVFGVTVGIFWYYREVYPLHEYYAQFRETESLFYSLQKAVPESMDEKSWVDAVASTLFSFGTVFYGPSSSPYDELVAFDRDLRDQLSDTSHPDSQTLRWIWHRLEQVDTFGRDLLSHHRDYLEHQISHAERLESAALKEEQ